MATPNSVLSYLSQLADARNDGMIASHAVAIAVAALLGGRHAYDERVLEVLLTYWTSMRLLYSERATQAHTRVPVWQSHVSHSADTNDSCASAGRSGAGGEDGALGSSSAGSPPLASASANE
jgi:hypothetical protein